MASPAGFSSKFVFPGSAQRRRSSLDVPMKQDEDSERVENPLLLNLRTPLAAATHNNHPTSSPLLPFSPFSPPPSLRAPPSKGGYSAAVPTTAAAADAENRGFEAHVPPAALGLRHRKTATGAAADSFPWSSNPSESPPPEPLPKTSYSLGTHHCAPVLEPTRVFSTGGAPPMETVAPAVSDTGRSPGSNVGIKDSYCAKDDLLITFTTVRKHHPITDGVTDLFAPPELRIKSPECSASATEPPVLHNALSEDDILNYPVRASSRTVSSSGNSLSCWEQVLRCLFGMDDDDCDFEQCSFSNHDLIVADPILREKRE